MLRSTMKAVLQPATGIKAQEEAVIDDVPSGSNWTAFVLVENAGPERCHGEWNELE